MWPFKRIDRQIKTLAERIDKMAIDYTKLESSVTALSGVVPGVVTLLSTLSQEVKDLAAQLDPAKDAATQTKLNDFATRLDAKTDALAAAVAANTPASP